MELGHACICIHKYMTVRALNMPIGTLWYWSFNQPTLRLCLHRLVACSLQHLSAGAKCTFTSGTLCVEVVYSCGRAAINAVVMFTHTCM